MQHPTVLTDRGLEAAVQSLARRAPLPVDVRGVVPERLEPAIETAAYFIVAEALTNVAKYARANAVSVDLQCTNGTLVVTIADDGVGGADPGRGSGLRGLVDRVQAVGGRLEVYSPPSEGTRLRAQLPTNVLGSLCASSPVAADRRFRKDAPRAAGRPPSVPQMASLPAWLVIWMLMACSRRRPAPGLAPGAPARRNG
jgi:signal transduction histidine kinase